jgi:hypothetical protein
MGTVKDGSNGGRKCTRAGLTLPTLASPVTAGVAANRITVTVGANGLPPPPSALKMFNRLFLSLKRLKQLDDVHMVIPS